LSLAGKSPPLHADTVIADYRQRVIRWLRPGRIFGGPVGKRQAVAAAVLVIAKETSPAIGLEGFERIVFDPPARAAGGSQDSDTACLNREVGLEGRAGKNVGGAPGKWWISSPKMRAAMSGGGLASMTEDGSAQKKIGAVRVTPDEMAARMNAVLEAARSEGIAIPPDLARRTFAVTRRLAALRRREDGGA
jgi:hypothetical protein